MTSADSGDSQGLGIEPADAVDFVPADQAVAPAVPGTVPPPDASVPSAPDTAAGGWPGEQSVASVPSTTTPDRTAELALRRPGAFLVGLVGVIIVAVVAALGVRAVSANRPAPSPTGPTWSGPWQTGVTNSGAAPGLGDVIVVGPFNTRALTGFDLSTKQVTFSLTPDELTEPSGDATGFVAIVAGQIEAVEPSTGRILGQAPLPASASVDWAGHGLILTEQLTPFSLCARAMADPGTCLWTAESTSASRQNVFGDGRWVNTGTGVVDLATGQPANFGQDSGFHRSPTGDTFVYYDGSSPDRVFRVVVTVDDGFKIWGNSTYQPWDITTDQATAPAIAVDRVVTDPTVPVFMGFTYQNDMSTMDINTVATAYTWPDGKALWQQPTSIAGRDFEQFVDGNFLTAIQTTGPVPDPVVAFDATTGATAWQSSLNANNFYGRLGHLILMVDHGTLVAYDASAGCQVAWRSTLPKLATAWCVPGVAGTHIYCSGVDGQVYLLDL